MLVDSNILIYATDPEDTVSKDFLTEKPIAITTLTRIEVLGFPGFKALSMENQHEVHKLLSSVVEIELKEDVIVRAIELRQLRRMKVVDAVIAATAIVHNLDLATRNTADFRHIESLQLINPYAQIGSV